MTDTVNVPREPTSEMIAAACGDREEHPVMKYLTPEERGGAAIFPLAYWRAMLAAAPKVEQEPVNSALAAYGALWCMVTDNPAIHAARKHLLAAIGGQGSEAQRQAIMWAGRNVMPPSDAEIAAIDTHPAQASDELPASILDIAAERQRQVAIEGWSHERDDGYVAGELAIAGACYALLGSRKWAIDALRCGVWPKGWSARWLKSEPNNPRRDLVKAGALIAAEIERLDRLAKHKGPQS